MLRASIDLMGGENAPDCILAAAATFSTVHFVFVGSAFVLPLIQKYNIEHYTFIEATLVLEEGVRYSKSELVLSSLYIAILQVKLKNADFVVSSGPTAYYLLLARKLLGFINGITRPAIAALLPAKKPTIMMDLGANLVCEANDLVNFAIMGSALAKFWLGLSSPSVGFLNVGSEYGKGPEHIKNALLQYSKINKHSSFIEGNAILDGKKDVVIIEGFAGNCLLKFGEGVFKFLKQRISHQFNHDFLTRFIGFFSKRILKNALVDARKFNGGIFAGINGCVIKSHGSADFVGFSSAIAFGSKIASSNDKLLSLMAQDIEKYQKNKD